MNSDLTMNLALWAAVEALSSAIGTRNNIKEHSVNVAAYSVRIGKALGMRGQALQELRLGALLHDVGQIFIPEELFRKHGQPITERERHIIEAHTLRGAEFVRTWGPLHFTVPFILWHQEKVDGSGYPYHLKGDAIPREVQIVSIADVYDALRQPRQYRNRPGLSHDEVIEKMARMRGKSWDADLFDAFAATSKEWDKPLEFRVKSNVR
jgi:HD-GYP domain-containing protein (c-di-GMP phosphodiesterase class II)